MKRLSHDLPGVAQRIAKLSHELGVATEEVAQFWKDEKGRQFVQRRMLEAGPKVNLLVSALNKSIEAYEDIARRLSDPDRY